MSNKFYKATVKEIEAIKVEIDALKAAREIYDKYNLIPIYGDSNTSSFLNCSVIYLNNQINIREDSFCGS